MKPPSIHNNRNNLYVINGKRPSAMQILNNYIKETGTEKDINTLSATLSAPFTYALNNLNKLTNQNANTKNIIEKFNKKTNISAANIFNAVSNKNTITNNILNKYAILVALKVSGKNRTGVNQTVTNKFVNSKI